MITAHPDFARELLDWYRRHGRHDLPWKHDPTAYRVWVSEIMLQQTQVKTVLDYYPRFITHFPTVSALADAELDAVLAQWSGLGYYARGRNLHRAAQIIRDEYAGAFPVQIEALMDLPGIGRSTAGAILALSQDQRHPILDGNVKRVLARYHAVEGWPGEAAVTATLWDLAEQHTPARSVAEYTQAIMDLGASLCSRTRPKCLLCPVASRCVAHRSGRESEFPRRKPKRAIPQRETVFLLIRDRRGRILLERRPPSGIWGGLWSFPEAENADAVGPICAEQLGVEATHQVALPTRQHGFTHYRLDIHPVLLDVKAKRNRVMEPDRRVWYKPSEAQALGLPAPVATLLNEVFPELKS